MADRFESGEAAAREFESRQGRKMKGRAPKGRYAAVERELRNRGLIVDKGRSVYLLEEDEPKP